RISRLGEFWQPLLEAAGIPVHYVICIRDPAEVAGSLEKRNGFPYLKSFYLWLLYNLDVLRLTADSRIIVRYQDVLDDPQAAIEQCRQALALDEPDAEEVRRFCDEFVSKGLHHHQDLQIEAPLPMVERLYEGLTGSESEQLAALVEECLQGLAADAQTRSALTLAAELERSLSREKDNQEKELSDVIDRQRKDIEDFRDYQEKLEAEKADLRRYQEKLEKEKQAYQAYQEKLEKDLTGQRDWSEKQRQDIEALQNDLAALDADRQQLQATNGSLREQLSETDLALHQARAEAERESMRLWEIIEKYRQQVDAMEASHCWRITAPLRWSRRQIQMLPYRVKRGIRYLVFLLPEDSMLRQRLIKVYERSVLFLRGEVDSAAVRESHHAMVAARRRLLGHKPVLPADQLPVVDLSIVTYNSAGWIEGFVASLRGQSYPLDRLHLYFVDNGSTDETVARLNARDWSDFAGYTLIESDNRGFGAGHNQSIRAGDSEFVLVTNIDLEFRADTLPRLVSFAAQDDADAASWEVRQAPFEHPKFYDPVSLQTPWSSHACILMRREALAAAGGYEEKIFMYGEDVELSYRFRSLGYKLRYVPSAVVNHYTYDEPGQVKQLQYQGSTLANAYLRMRYGSWFDVFRILPMYLALARGRAGFAGNYDVVKKNARLILANAMYFLRRRTGQSFAFRGWDYDIVRNGAFHELPEPVEQPPLVSVITRSYRGRDSLLLECLQSVAHQTWGNIEHVIVEDGGASLADTIAAFEAQYPGARVAYYPLPKGGRCETGNRGLELAKGEYLMFLDDDDLLFSDHLEICLAELAKDPELGAVYALAWEVETEFQDGHYEEKSHGTPDIFHQAFDREVLLDHNFIPIQSIVFRRSLYEQHGGFDPDLDNLEDWNLWIRYSTHSDFRLVGKTTSMFRTPWDLEEKARRQQVLDEYLPVAREKNRQSDGHVAGKPVE
ncbi:MAG: glycosyltransferase, partial [Proteobacteria bacterium]|nr:glycosyltransferase [Pseudomonadota bacterium]